MTIDSDLRQLVLDNWGLVYDLHKRAEEVRADVLAQTYEQLQGDDSWTGGPGMTVERNMSEVWLNLSDRDMQICYVSAKVPTIGHPRPNASVQTVFRNQPGMSYNAIKGAVSDALRAEFRESFDSSGQRSTTVQRLVDGRNLDELVRATVDEMARQLPVALEIRTFISGELAARRKELLDDDTGHG